MTMFLTIAIPVSLTPPDPTGVLAERPVAHTVQAVLDPPVATDQPEQLLRAGALARQARDPQHHLGLDLRAVLRTRLRRKTWHSPASPSPGTRPATT